MTRTDDAAFYRGVPTASAVRQIVREEVQAAQDWEAVTDAEIVAATEAVAARFGERPGYAAIRCALEAARKVRRTNLATNRRPDGGNE